MPHLAISFDPYSKLWRTTSLFVANHNVSTSGPLSELDTKNVESDILKMSRRKCAQRSNDFRRHKEGFLIYLKLNEFLTYNIQLQFGITGADL